MQLCATWLMAVALQVGSGEDAAELEPVVTLLEFVLEADEQTAVECLNKLTHQAQTGELSLRKLQLLRQRLGPTLRPILTGGKNKPVYPAAIVLAALWGDTVAVDRVRELAWDRGQSETLRGTAMEALAAIQDPQLLTQAERVLAAATESPQLAARLIDALSRYEQPAVAQLVLHVYQNLPAEIQPKAIALLIQRPTWSKQLLASIARGDLPTSVLNVNHLRALLASRDPDLAALSKKQFGSVRVERDPRRERVIAQMGDLFSRTPGNAVRGQEVFHRVCGQCHRIHGTGQDVGPDITSNGRATFDQLLSNVFDPSLVIGPAYQAVTVVTQDGRVLTGLLAEDNPQRIVLKIQGGKIESVPRSEIDEVAPSKLSLMPEGVEKQLSPQEIADLFSFLVFDRPPQDASARPIPGTPTLPVMP